MILSTFNLITMHWVGSIPLMSDSVEAAAFQYLGSRVAEGSMSSNAFLSRRLYKTSLFQLPCPLARDKAAQSSGEKTMRYVITCAVSGVVAWMTSPYYLSITPSINSVAAKFVAFLVLWLILSLIVKKR